MAYNTYPDSAGTCDVDSSSSRGGSRSSACRFLSAGDRSSRTIYGWGQRSCVVLRAQGGGVGTRGRGALVVVGGERGLGQGRRQLPDGRAALRRAMKRGTRGRQRDLAHAGR